MDKLIASSKPLTAESGAANTAELASCMKDRDDWRRRRRCAARQRPPK